MARAWDTTLVSRLKPEPSNAAFRYAEEQASAGTPIQLSAVALHEACYGYAAEASRRPEFTTLLAWLVPYVDSGRVEILALDGRAAVVAARLRAATQPTPPSARGDRRSKSLRRIAWLFDIQIAATAWVAGHDVATANRRDFERIAQTLAELFPAAPPLGVFEPPF